MPTPEPEFLDAAGVARKTHYGTGRQPWDLIVEAGWGAHFAAGNVLKYLRRAAAKNGDDDVAKARWYFARLMEMVHRGDAGADAAAHGLHRLLTAEERAIRDGRAP